MLICDSLIVFITQPCFVFVGASPLVLFSIIMQVDLLCIKLYATTQHCLLYGTCVESSTHDIVNGPFTVIINTVHMQSTFDAEQQTQRDRLILI